MREGTFNLTAYMKKRDINARMTGELLGVNQSCIYEWMRKGNIPYARLQVLLSLTKEETDAKKRWIKYDLTALRENLGMDITEFADELGVKESILRNWEKGGRALRALLPRIHELEREARE